MSKYSDHTTVGGQVLAHRMRMMKQNWHIILIIGKIGFLLSFLFGILMRWKINDIWNYLCITKAVYRSNMASIPCDLFSNSCFWLKSGKLQWLSDYYVASNNNFLLAKDSFENFVWTDLKISLLIGLLSMIIMVIINKFFGKALSDNKEIISGNDYVDAITLKKTIQNKSDICLAGVPYPISSECRHTIITGTTGAGKTNVFHELLQQIIGKGERAIIVDTVGTYTSHYFQADRDVILNPLDAKSRNWNLFSECSEATEEHQNLILKTIAECVITNDHGSHDFWDKAARIVFVETAKKAIKEQKSFQEFLQLLLQLPLELIAEYLSGTYGYSIMDIRAEKMALSVRTTLINSVSAFDILKQQSELGFSIRNWINSNDKNSRFLFLSCTPNERATLIPLITSWLAIASESLLHNQPTSKRTWFLIDELHNLKRLPSLELSLAEIRKFGGCYVIGTQMISQLNKIYSYEVAKTITGLCGTKVIMCTPEPETARYMSDFLGEKEEVTTSEAISYGANTMRDGANISQHKEIKKVVPPSEIMHLKPGEAFLSFPGIDHVAKVKFELH